MQQEASEMRSASVTTRILSSSGRRTLVLSDGRTEIGAALDFGLRIVRLNLKGKKNLMYRQPADASDGCTTREGWRIYGGHRLWLAPESHQTYFPDNDPVEYVRIPGGVQLRQSRDEWLRVRKSMEIRFLSGGAVRILHEVENCAEQPLTCALWGVSTVSGGRGEIPFTHDPECSRKPIRNVALWGETSLGDARLQFEKDRVRSAFKPGVEDYCKIGVFSREGTLRLEHLGQRLTVTTQIVQDAEYPDLGCNAELYLCSRFMELETLGPVVTIAPGGTAGHVETWFLEEL